MRLSEAQKIPCPKSGKRIGYRVQFYRNDKIEYTPELDEPALKSHLEAYQIAKKISTVEGCEDIVVMSQDESGSLQRNYARIVLNQKRLKN